jgi:hypothetical protein
MRLIESGEPEKHVALMTDVMRNYLSARVEGVQRSQTTRQLLAAATSIGPHAAGLSQLLESADLVKFARQGVSPDDARTMGNHARSIVKSVEDHFINIEKANEADSAERASAEKRAA